MILEEKMLIAILNEANKALVIEGVPRGLVYFVAGRQSSNQMHKAQLMIAHSGLPVLIIDFPLLGFSREVDLVHEIMLAEKHLLRKAVEVLGAYGAVRLAVTALATKKPMVRTIPVERSDGNTYIPFSDN